MTRQEFLELTGLSEAQRIDRGRRGAMAFAQRKWGSYDAIDVALTLSAEYLIASWGLSASKAAEVCRAAEPEVRRRADAFMANAHAAAICGVALENWVAGAVRVSREVQRAADQPSASEERLIGFCYRDGEVEGAGPIAQIDLKPYEARSSFLAAVTFNIARGALVMFVKARRESPDLYQAVCASAGLEAA